MMQWLTSHEWALAVKALLHTLWQGAIIAVVLGLALRRVVNPVKRYRLSLGALAGVFLAGILTWALLNRPDATQQPVVPVAPVVAASQPSVTLSSDVSTVVVTVHPSDTSPRSQRWTAWLALVWLVGAALMLGRAGIQVAGAERLRRSTRPLEDSRVAQLLAEAQRAVQLTRKIRVAVTDKLTSPAVVGVLVPTLILPLSLVTTLTPEQMRFVLLHELAHIRRGDYFANLFQMFIEALLFFNPAVWWIGQQVRREREACCDALAIELSGAPVDYAKTLVRVAENILSPVPAAATAFGGGQSESSSLADRVQRLLVPGYRPALRLTWRAMAVSLLVGGALLVLSALGTQSLVNAASQVNNSTGLEKIPDPAQPAQFITLTDSNSTAVIDLSESSDGKLFTRTFKVDAGQFARRFGFSTPEPVAQGGSGRSQTRTNEFQTGFINLRNHFLTNGINLDGSAGKAIYYKDQQGWLYVRATLKELDAIEPVLAQLQREATIINIKARFIEVPSAQMPRVMNLLLTNAGSMGPQLFVQQHLADPEAKKILNELDAMPGVQLLSAPEVTTLNGRQAQIQIVDIKTIVTGLTPVLTNGGTNMMPATQAIPFGPTLDIVPTLSADDLTIEMRVIPTVTEFLGYDDPRKLPGYDVRAGAENVPLPRIRVRQMAESIAVGEGQTVVLGGFKDQTITTIPSGSKTNATQGVDKHLLVFITPTIVDSNGNRVYPGGDIKNDKAGQP